MAFVFVDSAASGANNGTSWTDAWTSLATAMLAANVAPGDVLLVSGTFNETASITEAGGQTSPVVVQGDDKSGGAGAGVAADFTIDGQSTRANCLTTTLGANTNTYYVFKNMICTGATGWGVGLANCRAVTIKKSRFHANAGGGAQLTNSGCATEECQADGNGNATTEFGIHLGTAGVSLGDTAFNNSGHGISCNGAVLHPLAYNNGTAGVQLAQVVIVATTGGVALNVTADGNSLNNAVGVQFSASIRTACVVNCIMYNCDGTAGIGMKWGANLGETAISRNNLVNSNLANYSSAATYSGEKTGAPQFTNVGVDDYTLASGSPAKAAGTDAGDVVNGSAFMDIGAHQREEAGGGGGAGITKLAGAGGGLVG